MAKGVYKLKYTLNAIDLKRSNQANKTITKLFNAGDKFVAETFQDDCSIVDNRYVIPDEYLEKVSGDAGYLKKKSNFSDTSNRIKEQAIEISERQKEKAERNEQHIRDGIQGEIARKTKNAAKAYKSGAIFGLAGGVLLALYLKKNAVILGGIGLAVGGYVGNKLHKASNGIDSAPKKAES